MTVYTNKSKTQSGTGLGIHFEELNLNYTFPLGNHFTIFQTELVVLIHHNELNFYKNILFVTNRKLCSWD